MDPTVSSHLRAVLQKTSQKKDLLPAACATENHAELMAAISRLLELSCSVSLGDPERRRALLKTNALCLNVLLHALQQAVVSDAEQIARSQAEVAELMAKPLADFARKHARLNNAFFSVLFRTPLLFCGVIPSLQRAITGEGTGDYKRLEHLQLLTILLQNLNGMNCKEKSGVAKYAENVKAVREWTKDKIDNLQKEENKVFKPEERRKVLNQFMKTNVLA